MVRPEKRIKTDKDLDIFLSSRPFAELWAFMLRLNRAVVSEKCSFVRESDASPAVRRTLEMLHTLRVWIENIDKLDLVPGRFGNKAFRIWHGRLHAQAAGLVEPIINAAPNDVYLKKENTTAQELADELGEYLATSFGNETRIDYGSGHEAHFLVLLFCLWKVGAYTEEDDAGLVLLVFRGYLDVTRRLQTKYTLEPAGSRGVWGLDDFSFLPFLWGSAQLLGRTSSRVRACDVMKEEVIREYREEYLYVDAIGVISEVKTGPFFEHSPTLFDISQVKGGWVKINQGMIKMYKAEVWGKRPVVQHVLFGSVFKFEERKVTRAAVGEDSSQESAAECSADQVRQSE